MYVIVPTVLPTLFMVNYNIIFIIIIIWFLICLDENSRYERRLSNGALLNETAQFLSMEKDLYTYDCWLNSISFEFLFSLSPSLKSLLWVENIRLYFVKNIQTDAQEPRDQQGGHAFPSILPKPPSPNPPKKQNNNNNNKKTKKQNKGKQNKIK